eukprot:jgi/Ulvmu1/1200/UM108_0028.1
MERGGDDDVRAVSVRGADAGRRERLFVSLTLLCAGHTVVLRDAGRITRNMAYNSILPNMLHCEIENMHVRVFRKLQLSPEQCARMAACWHTWLKRRRALNAVTEAALDTLASLPKTLTLTPLHLRHISRLAAGPLCAACVQQADATGPGHVHGAHACGSHDSVMRHGRLPDVCEQCGDAVDACSATRDGHVEDEEAGMLGADPESTCRAAEALQQLWRMHDADSALAVSVMALQRKPGAMLDLRQQTLECQLAFERGSAPIDRLVLCQLAATQVRRQELRQWPEVLTKPPPMRM